MGEVTRNTIDTLIKFGARCDQPNKNAHWEPIHYTAINANKEKMEAILSHLSKDQINSLVTCTKHTFQKYTFCSKKIEKTYSNNALTILLKYGNREKDFHACCQLLIDKGINVQQADSKGVTPSDLIWKLHDDKLNRLLKVRSAFQDNFKDSFGLLRLNSINRFISMDLSPGEANSLDGKDENVSSCTLLQVCCAKGMTACVKHLLEKGASPSKVTKKNPEHPIVIAINGDHEEMVKVFLSRHDVVLPDDILLQLQMLYNNKKKVSTADKYMKMILKNLRRYDKETLQKYLRARDDLERTALHYAVHYKCTVTTLSLLSMGASLISEDIFGYTPLSSIDAHVLEKCFTSCISAVQEDETPTGFFQKKAQYSVKIDYGNLISKEKDVQESHFLYQMIGVPDLNHLMNHPVVASYLVLKWEKFKWWVYLNLSLYFVAYVSLLFDGLFKTSHFLQTSNVLLWIAYAVLLCRDLSQLLIFRLSYLKKAESIIDLSLIGAVTYIVIDSWISTTTDNKNLLVARSVVFLTSTIGIFNQLGNVSYFTIKVAMLRQISANFAKAMAFYIFPVVAFFFCFHVLSEKEHAFFDLLYDTVTMFAGDADGEFPEQQFEHNPIFGKTIYIIFVVSMGIILHNLLIGLAVSDLQEIRKQAEFLCKKEHAKYVVKVEQIIFSQFKNSKLLKPLFQNILAYLYVFKKIRACQGRLTCQKKEDT